MKWLVFDCPSGIAGDMTLGALVDLGVPLATLREALGTLPLAGYELRQTAELRHGIAATQVHVDIAAADPHAHRHLHDVHAILRGGALPARALQWAIAVFDRLARAQVTLPSGAKGMPGIIVPNPPGGMNQITAQPLSNLSLTADVYRTTIDGRIVLTSQFSSVAAVEPNAAIRARVGQILAPFQAQGVTTAQFFTNAVDTKTLGLDVVVAYATALGGGTLNLTGSANFTKTEAERVNVPQAMADSFASGNLDTVRVRILNPEGDDCAPGEVCEVYFRPPADRRGAFSYIGATAKRFGDWVSLGDLGHLDADGYLYLAVGDGGAGVSSNDAQDLALPQLAPMEVMEGKGMIVCMSRRICVELYNQIIKLRPEWHSDDDARGQIKIVMSGSASDIAEWQPHIRTNAPRKLCHGSERVTVRLVRTCLSRASATTSLATPTAASSVSDHSLGYHPARNASNIPSQADLLLHPAIGSSLLGEHTRS